MKSVPFLQRLNEAIAANRLQLPTLPDVALRAAKLCESKDVTAAQLATEIARDPGIAARVVRIANSAALGSLRATTLQQAIARIGLQLTRLLVSALATEQLYRATAPELAQLMRRSWANCIEIAALTRAIARLHTKINSDEALLAGLLHEVGMLPIVALAGAAPEVWAEVSDDTLIRLQALAGRLVLAAWNFPPAFVGVPEGCLEFAREHDGPADLADLVCVALLQPRPLRAPWLGAVDRGRVPAFARLGLDPEGGVPASAEFEQQLAEARALLAG